MALIPGVLALLPQYAGLVDPVADLRAACLEAVAWLGDEVTVLADPQGRRVAEHLLAVAPPTAGEPSYLVVGNGSACRSEKAPGHLDERSFAFDHDLGAWLRGRGPRPSLALGRELLAGIDGFAHLDEQLTWGEPYIDFDADPFGVQYWVMRWQCAS